MVKKRSKKDRIRLLTAKAWKVFSLWVRTCEAVDEMVKCYTCEVIKHYKEMHAGHYKHMGKAKFYSLTNLFLNEIGIRPQCPQCNNWKHGNLGEYAIHLVKDWGLYIVDEINLEGNKVKVDQEAGLENIIKVYTQKIKDLEERYGYAIL